MRRTAIAASLLMGCGVATYTAAQSGNAAAPAGAEWRSYAADSFSTKYSPLDQINAENVNKLRVAWRWKSSNFGPRNEGNMETTPLMIGGRLFFTAGQRRVVIAADAETGERCGCIGGKRASARVCSRGRTIAGLHTGRIPTVKSAFSR